MADWIDACATYDIEEEEMIRFDHDSRTFIIVRDHEDNYYCTDGMCTHENVHLSDGLVVEATIECPKHSSIFDMTTGEVETPPACDNLHTYSHQGQRLPRLRRNLSNDRDHYLGWRLLRPRYVCLA